MRLFFLFFMLIALVPGMAQERLAEAKFHEGSQYYINGNRDKALSSVNTGLMSDPGNQKLTELKKLLEEDKKKEEQKKKDEEKKEKEKKEQQKKEDQKKEKEKKDQEKKDQQDKDKKDKEEKDKEQKDKEQKEKEEKDKKPEEKEEKKDQKSKEKKETPPEVSEKLKDMKMTEDKAKMILEAMKNQEVQYLQQNKRKATKPKDKGKPDW